MRAMVLPASASVDAGPLKLQELADPRPAGDEILLQVTACGVCRTDLHVVEGELHPPEMPIVPGHQIVGRVIGVGSEVTRFRPGDRAGIAWVHRFCGCCDYCIEGRENLCQSPTFTGFHRHGGFAEKAVAPAAFAHPIPDSLGQDARVAPLLCAGIIGYRALKRSGLRPGARLALYGFGSAAHIGLQIAVAWGCEVFVVTRGHAQAERARAMGAAWTGSLEDRLPRPVDHAVTFAPVGSILPVALRDLRRGGTLSIAGIYLDEVPPLDYEEHLFQERNLVSVTANTRQDARELLDLAARVPVVTDIERFALEDANEALLRLKSDRLRAQSAVLEMS